MTAEPTTFRTCDEDGTHHFSHLKKLADSGREYLYAVNTPFEPTSSMLIGTIVHRILLGPRPGKIVLRYPKATRQGDAWKDFKAANRGAEIATSTEWDRAEEIAFEASRHPLVQRALEGARFEVPLAWEEAGIRCSTGGVDIITADLGELKTTANVEPRIWKKQVRRMHYPEQMAWYRRGARANGIPVRGLFILGLETKPPFDVVPFELTDGLIDVAERNIALWLETLRGLRAACPTPTSVRDWPGYTQSPIPLELESWESGDEDEDDEEEAA